MTKYKGYYIDNVIFTSKNDIDNFIKSELINKVKKYSKILFEAPDSHITPGYVHGFMEMITAAEDRLHKEYDMSYEEIEKLELDF